MYQVIQAERIKKESAAVSKDVGQEQGPVGLRGLASSRNEQASSTVAASILPTCPSSTDPYKPWLRLAHRSQPQCETDSCQSVFRIITKIESKQSASNAEARCASEAIIHLAP